MLQIWLDRCGRLGVEEVLINLHSHANLVRQFLQSDNTSGVRVQVSDEPELLGSAGTIRANSSWVAGEPGFWVFYADVLTDADLADMVKFHEERNSAATIGVYRVADPSRCGIVQLDTEGWVTEFIEKPRVPIGNLAFSGIILARPDFMHAVPERIPSDIGFDVLPKLVGRTAAYEIKGYLIDIGTMENYRSAQENWRGVQFNYEQERHA